MNIREISYNEILPLWQQLWRNRKSPIEPVSSMIYLGGHDIQIKTEYSPLFLGVFDDYDEGRLIGVNSGVRTSPKHYRSRGLYVLKEHRGRGIASWLLLKTIEQGKAEKCDMIWSMPRKEALYVYQKVGFEQTSKWINEGVEFGPNCYVARKLNV